VEIARNGALVTGAAYSRRNREVIPLDGAVPFPPK